MFIYMDNKRFTYENNTNSLDLCKHNYTPLKLFRQHDHWRRSVQMYSLNYEVSTICVVYNLSSPK